MIQGMGGHTGFMRGQMTVLWEDKYRCHGRSNTGDMGGHIPALWEDKYQCYGRVNTGGIE